MICPRCSSALREGELACPRCGYSMNNPTNTMSLKVGANLLRIRKESKDHDFPISDDLLILTIRGLNERIPLDKLHDFVFGRSDVSMGYHPGLDLSPYGATERGVSRAHAQINYVAGQLTITDLGSSNGTLLNDNRLRPNQPYPVKDGDELILGRLPITVHYSAKL